MVRPSSQIRYNMLMAGDSLIEGTPSPIGTPVDEMSDFYTSARTMMYDPTVNNAFKFSAADQQKYGNSGFGAACVTTRNVLAADLGVRYVQITLGGWDNHTNIYAPNNGIYPSARQLDAGLGNLIADLASLPGSQGRSMLDDTLIVVKGEFGRTVGNITGGGGRDHYYVHSTLIGGGGVRGGRAWEKTSRMPRLCSMIQVGPSNDRMRKISQPLFIRWVSITRRFVTTIRSVADSTSRKTRRGWEHQSQNCFVNHEISNEDPSRS
jgi:uncharacterized protein (DUF1501 family)